MTYWAQVYFFADELIECVFRINHHARDALVGDKMVGTKLGILRRGIARLEDDGLARLAITFADLAGRVQQKRNHAAHGVWAWHIEPGQVEPVLSARRVKSLSDRLEPRELDELVSLTAKATRAGIDALQVALGREPGYYAVRLFYGQNDMGDEWEPPRH